MAILKTSIRDTPGNRKLLRLLLDENGLSDLSLGSYVAMDGWIEHISVSNEEESEELITFIKMKFNSLEDLFYKGQRKYKAI